MAAGVGPHSRRRAQAGVGGSRRTHGLSATPGALTVGHRIKEIFYTLHGEGTHAGRPAVFCRFSLCNLWTGRQEDRARAACQFCDTDFGGTDGRGGGTFETAEDLATAVATACLADERPRTPHGRMHGVSDGPTARDLGFF